MAVLTTTLQGLHHQVHEDQDHLVHLVVVVVEVGLQAVVHSSPSLEEAQLDEVEVQGLVADNLSQGAQVVVLLASDSFVEDHVMDQEDHGDQVVLQAGLLVGLLGDQEELVTSSWVVAVAGDRLMMLGVVEVVVPVTSWVVGHLGSCCYCFACLAVVTVAGVAAAAKAFLEVAD